MLCHLKKLATKQRLKTQYFVILKKYTERITIAVLLSQQPIEVLHVIPKIQLHALTQPETRKLQQVCCRLAASCDHQADIRMRSHRLLRLDDNNSAASCQQACCKLRTADLLQIANQARIQTVSTVSSDTVKFCQSCT